MSQWPDCLMGLPVCDYPDAVTDIELYY